jgi:hypothetical protein
METSANPLKCTTSFPALFPFWQKGESPGNEVVKCYFLDFGEDLTEFWWSENSVLVCRNLQFSSTKWAKLAYLIYWISCRKVWVISSFFAVCHGLNDKDLHDFEKWMIRLLANCKEWRYYFHTFLQPPQPPPPVATALLLDHVFWYQSLIYLHSLLI